MTTRRERVVEDKDRGLLGTCPHSGPACWTCVVRDMERQRNEARASLAAAEREAEANAVAADRQRERAKAAERTLEAERGVVVACTRRAEAAEAALADLASAVRLSFSQNGETSDATLRYALARVSQRKGERRPARSEGEGGGA